MTAPGHTVFDTAIGPVGIAWGERGLVALQLPEATPEATRRRLLRRLSTKPGEAVSSQPGEAVSSQPSLVPPVVARAIAALTALLAGERVDLQDVALDLDGLAEFDRRVYEVARTIQPGETLTYGAIAERLGDPGAARDVGQAMGRNPFPLVVPCHRVVAAGGKLGGFSAAQGVVTKRRLLEIEGAVAQRSLF